MIRKIIVTAVFSAIAVSGTPASADDGLQDFNRSVQGATKAVGNELNKAGRNARDTVNKAASDVNKAVKSDGKKPEGKKKNRKEPAKTD